MKVLITGGSGFIGSRLVARCLDRGDHVRVLGQVNNPVEKRNRDDIVSVGAEFKEGSVTDAALVNEAAKGRELIFHLAAAQHEANVPDRHFYEVNVEGTRNMLEAAVKNGVKRFVHGSTIGVYGAAMSGELDEASPLQPDNIYGKTKLEGERLVLSYKNKLPVAVVRISETYGPGDNRLLKLFKAINKKAFFMIGKGDNVHQLIYVDDLIDGLFRAAEATSALNEIFVIAGAEKLTTHDMVQAVAAALHKTIPRWRAPLWLFMTAAVALETTLKPLGIQPPLHRRRMDFFRKSFYFKQDKVKNILQFSPKTSFAQGVALTAAWYKARGLLD